ncbi:UNVERIFIED_CONTAM: hypothetical protein K2H54_017458 [Gekko kuhli]
MSNVVTAVASVPSTSICAGSTFGASVVSAPVGAIPMAVASGSTVTSSLAPADLSLPTSDIPSAPFDSSLDNLVNRTILERLAAIVQRFGGSSAMIGGCGQLAMSPNEVFQGQVLTRLSTTESRCVGTASQSAVLGDEEAQLVEMQEGQAEQQIAASGALWGYIAGSRELDKKDKEDLDERDKECLKRHSVNRIYANWYPGFSIYAGEIVRAQPWRASPLLQYMDIIYKGHSDFAGSAWMEYDKAFCTEAAMYPALRRDQIHLHLWMQTMSPVQAHSASDSASDLTPSVQAPMVPPRPYLSTLDSVHKTWQLTLPHYQAVPPLSSGVL